MRLKMAAIQQINPTAFNNKPLEPVAKEEE